jgi:hypothetical protein
MDFVYEQNRLNSMTKMEFINTICKPHIKVALDLFLFLKDDETSLACEKFSQEQIGDWQVPWYIDKNGKGSEYHIPGSVPIKIKETLMKLDPGYSSHKEHIDRIEYFTNLLSKEEFLFYAPILPIVGYDTDKTYIIFDGNHRIAASYLITRPEELTVLLMKSKKMKSINLDFKYHS